MIKEVAFLLGISIGFIVHALLSMMTIDEYRSRIYRLELSNSYLRELLLNSGELKYSKHREYKK